MIVATEVSLHRSLYDADAVTAVAARYDGLATFHIHAGEHDIVVAMTDIDPDVADVLVDHFCNLALQETIVRHNQAEATMTGQTGDLS